MKSFRPPPIWHDSQARHSWSLLDKVCQLFINGQIGDQGRGPLLR